MTLGSERSEQEESGKNLRKGGKKNTRKKEEALFSLSLLLRLSENKRERERERNRVIFRDVHSLLVTRRVCKSVLVKIRENVFSSLSCDRILLILGRKTFSRTNSSVLSRIVILDYYRATSVTIFRGVERRLEVGVKSCIAEASRVCNINASSSKSSPNFLLEGRTFG